MAAMKVARLTSRNGRVVRHLCAEEAWRGGDQLPELHVRRAELLEGQVEGARVGVLGEGAWEKTAPHQGGEVPPADAESLERAAPELAAARAWQRERDGPRVRRRTGAHAALVRAMKSTTARASSSPLSSWRKWPAPVMVVCGWPSAPGIACWRMRSAPPVIGSESLKAVRNGFVQRPRTSHALRFGAAAGSSRVTGTSIRNCRAPTL